jgi:hypothetical protein
LGANRTENRQINFRVSEEEYQRLEQMATNFGMTVPMFCKKKSQGARMKSPKIDRQGAIQIASELRRIGVNVNQIAKHLNSGENVSEGQINAFSAIKKECSTLPLSWISEQHSFKFLK